MLQTEWKGYGYQKNFALAQAKGDWILMLDADEVVDPTLGEAIQRAIASDGGADGYSMRRVNFFRDARIRYGAGRPDDVDRLFRRGKGRVSDHRVHERVIVDGRVEKLPGELLHYTTESITQRVVKNDGYATTAAEEMHRAGKTASLTKLLLILPLSMFRDLVVKGGILDGRVGVIMAATSAFYSFSKYAKLWEIERITRETATS